MDGREVRGAAGSNRHQAGQPLYQHLFLYTTHDADDRLAAVDPERVPVVQVGRSHLRNSFRNSAGRQTVGLIAIAGRIEQVDSTGGHRVLLTTYLAIDRLFLFLHLCVGKQGRADHLPQDRKSFRYAIRQQQAVIGQGIICNTVDQAKHLVTLRNQGNEMDQALRAVNKEADDPTACENDAMRLCGDAIPDVDRVTACMIAKQSQLSDGCRSVFRPMGTAPTQVNYPPTGKPHQPLKIAPNKRG